MVSNIYPNILYLRAYRNKTSQIAVFLNKYINSHVILYIFFILGEGRVIQKNANVEFDPEPMFPKA